MNRRPELAARSFLNHLLDQRWASCVATDRMRKEAGVDEGVTIEERFLNMSRSDECLTLAIIELAEAIRGSKQ